MSLSYVEELSLSYLLTKDDIDVLTEYPELIIGWHEFFIPFLIKNILKYFYKSYREECLDGTHTIYDEDCNTYEWHNENREIHRANDKPAIIYNSGTLEWRLNDEFYNSSGPYSIYMIAGKLHSLTFNYENYIYVERYFITFKNEENTFSLFLNSHKLLTKNNLTTKQRVKTILKEDVLELLENYLPVSEVNFILSLPPIII